MRAKALGVLLLALGCGGTDKPGKSGAPGGQNAGGTTGSAGSSSTSSGNGSGGAGTNTSGSSPGGSGGTSNPIGVTLGNTPAEACIAYAWAVCSRREECRGYDAGFYNCTTATLSCPDVTFSPGATRTAEVLQECAKTYATLACDLVRVEKLPSCVTPGTRARGEECSFASQCSSLSCAGSDTCGTCGVRATKGESCAQADVECEVGTTCNTDTDLCETPTVIQNPTPGANEACVPDVGCVAGYYCKLDGLGGGTCTPEAKANESCAQTPCAYGSYCAPDSVCKPYPSAGQPCGMDKSGEFVCTNSTCEVAAGVMSGTCKPFPKLGEPCLTTAGNPDSGYCTDGLHCDLLTTPHVCKGPGKTGESCGGHSDCLGLSQCGCADPLQTDCPDKRCLALQVAGQPCTAPNTRCHPAFECLSGICQPITLRGDFGQACGM